MGSLEPYLIVSCLVAGSTRFETSKSTYLHYITIMLAEKDYLTSVGCGNLLDFGRAVGCNRYMKPMSFGTTLRLVGDKLMDITNCPCEDLKCQNCCEHAEFDHNICLDCEKEFDVLPGHDEDYGQDR
jgi:hypothetical protein